jgi:hypothetical protein
MVGAAVGLIIAGLVLSLFLGWFGFIISAVGIVLLVLWFAGVGRRAAERPS